tara:strand:+ start:646 stop:1344 length:699 start_codon:yes stop_codon:yes gene_type:complete
MALPKLDVPTYSVTLPVSQQLIRFRAFLVKEEKILLTGKEGSAKEQLQAMSQLLSNCVVSPEDFNPGELTMPDVEYLFIQLRARSVQNIVDLKYKDKEDGKVYDFEVDLDEIYPTVHADAENQIQLNDTIGIELQMPTINTMTKLDVDNMEDTENVYKLIAECTVKVWDEEQVYDDFTIPELVTFLKEMDIKMFAKMKDFFEMAPKLTHELHYTNSMGSERTIKLEGISDFF